MFEYHGWVTVSSSAGDEDVDPELASSIQNYLESQLAELSDVTGLVNYQLVNGSAQLHVGGFTNHRGGQGDKILRLFHDLAKVAPGSYGLLYLWDDEDSQGRTNEFQVFVMRRGLVSQEADSLLSPCIPVIEDAAD